MAGLYLRALVGPKHAEDTARAAMKLIVSASTGSRGAVGVDAGVVILENRDGSGPVIEAAALARCAGQDEVVIGESATARPHPPRSLPVVEGGIPGRPWRA